jgi:ABC-type branched-subunit amino acid transport system permease subunit
MPISFPSTQTGFMLIVLFTLQLSIVLGLCLTVVLGLAMKFGAGIFTKDLPVIEVIHKGIPVRTLPVC